MVNAGCFHSRQPGTNQVNHLRVISIREGRECRECREETGGDDGREYRDMEYRTKYELHNKTKNKIPTKRQLQNYFIDSGKQ